ncbi:MAG: 2,3-bisphosphoglycerate-independent phosphoglycerate mutase [Sulfolobales archaeon]|nr:2,3-bisphosphoglycerate-independent phosphoglycerate mutase [Sulfolobales archaeon]MDW8082248.1 2,3-bisphosphoglycerate-independent phosphoglycerate mutase [Sulfolobales archaeon]
MKELSVIVVVADGLGDRPVPSLGMKTPLELVDFSSVADVVSKSAVGLWDPIQPGIRPGSDTAHLALFGVNPLNNYPGRGPFEAIGAGATLKPGDLAFRGNFATVNSDLIVVDRRAGRKILEAKQLVEYLNGNIGEIDGVKVEIYHTTEHRVAVVFRGEDLSDAVSDTDPHTEGVRVLEAAPLASSESAARTARVVNAFTKRVHELLRDYLVNTRKSERDLPPANIVLLRGAGKMVRYPKLQERRELKIERSVAISATALVKGVCTLLGFEAVTPEGATGGVDSDLIAKARVAVDYYRRGYDLIYIHVKGTDSASHDGNPSAKIAVIEKLLKAVSYLVDRVDLEKTVIAVLGDHTTPVMVRDHTSDPVPVMIYAPGIMADGFTKLSEREARRGSLGRLRNTELFGILMDYSSRAEKFGA